MATRVGGKLSALCTTLTVLILAAPSFWMLKEIPPLWRDIDAYLQVTTGFGAITDLHYGPLYCVAARVPLYLGDKFLSEKAAASKTEASSFSQSTLTDSGVFLLILLQHAAFLCAGFRLITLAGDSPLIRILLALAWVANPELYTFAHSVGSEALSMILTIWLVTSGLTLLRQDRLIHHAWLPFMGLLCALMLTRHINAVLAMLLPLTFALLSLNQFVRAVCTRESVRKIGIHARGVKYGKHTVIAALAGVACIGFSSGVVRRLCYLHHIPCQSRIGVAFLSRLESLQGGSVDCSQQIFARAGARPISADAKALVSLLESTAATTAKWNLPDYLVEAQTTLSEPVNPRMKSRVAPALNEIARALLWPPDRCIVNAALSDTERSWRTTPFDVMKHLFVSTAFFFTQPQRMPGCAKLETFRDYNAATIRAIPLGHGYFRRWKSWPFTRCLLVWFAVFSGGWMAAKFRRLQITCIQTYAAALLLTSFVMVVLNFFLTEFWPAIRCPCGKC